MNENSTIMLSSVPIQFIVEIINANISCKGYALNKILGIN